MLYHSNIPAFWASSRQYLPSPLSFLCSISLYLWITVSWNMLQLICSDIKILCIVQVLSFSALSSTTNLATSLTFIKPFYFAERLLCSTSFSQIFWMECLASVKITCARTRRLFRLSTFGLCISIKSFFDFEMTTDEMFPAIIVIFHTIQAPKYLMNLLQPLQATIEPVL